MTTGHSRTGRVAVGLHAVSLAAGFLVLLYCNRDQWFFGDEWDFLGHRGVLEADRSIWAPHTDHWSTGAILVYRALYSLYGLKTYVPYVVVLLLLHVAVAHLLWRLMRRAAIDLPVATALVAVFVVLGAGAENLLWAFQIGFIGSLALGLAALLLVDHDGPWDGRDFGAWAVSIIGLTFSGVSVTMVAVAGMTVLMRRGLRQAALTVAVPGAVFMTWFLLIGNQNLGSSRRELEDVFDYPGYIWTGLRTAVEQAVGFPGAGPLLVLGLAVFLLRRGGQAAGPAAPVFACALGALVMFAIIAFGRTDLGVEQSEAPRYTYIVVALALPAAGLLLSELVGHGASVPNTAHVAGRRAVVCLLLLLVGLHNGGLLLSATRAEKRLEQDLKGKILAAAQLVTSPAVILGGHPETQFSPDIEVPDLRRMFLDDKLPTPTRITPAQRVAVATSLQYSVDRNALLTPFVAPLVDGVVGGTDERDGTGCIRVFPSAPTVELHVAGGDSMSLRVTTQVSGEITGYLRLFTPRLHTGPPHVDKVAANEPVFVNVTASVDQVVLRLPSSGTTEVCGVA